MKNLNQAVETDEEIFEDQLDEARGKEKDDEDDSSEKDDEEDEDEDEDEKPSKSKKKKMDEQLDLDEESLAMSTLKANSKPAGPDPKSKFGMMQTVMGQMNSMNKSDLIGFFNQVMSQFGPNKMPGAVDNSAKNSASIDMKSGKGPKTADAMPKLNVKEDVEEMFAGQDLSEEFKDKATTLFEAAVSARVTLELARLEEEYAVQIEESMTEFNESVLSKLDDYLTYVVENWIKENEVAIESALRNELMEEFIDGLKNLFAEHYIDVPNDKVDVLEALADKVTVLEQKLDESISENNELKGYLLESQRDDLVESLATDLTMTQREKFSALVEGIEFDGDLEVFEKKISIIKETYFNKDSAPQSSNITEETFEGVINEGVVNVDPSVNRYVQAIARTVKK